MYSGRARENQKPVQLRHKVDLLGAKSPYDFIHLTLNPAREQCKGSSHTKVLIKWGKRGSTECRLGAKVSVWGGCDRKCSPTHVEASFSSEASEPAKLNYCSAEVNVQSATRLLTATALHPAIPGSPDTW